MADRSYRTADPYRDLDVIDARAPRANQTVVGLVALAGVVTGEWWLLALVAAQLALGLTLGRRWCLACVAYFELLQPRIGEVVGAFDLRPHGGDADDIALVCEVDIVEQLVDEGDVMARRGERLEVRQGEAAGPVARRLMQRAVGVVVRR